MNEIYKKALNRLDKYKEAEPEILHWGSPILFFGSFENAKIATVGINPSDKEFVDNDNIELDLSDRRFHTVNSLQLPFWAGADDYQISQLISSCNDYFNNNPYDIWFKRLDFIVSGTSKSYYFPSNEVCHLDLIPYATKTKWGDLENIVKNRLLNDNTDLLTAVLAKSNIEYLILNGASVVKNFQNIFNIKLERNHYEPIDLKRNGLNVVQGFCYEGKIDKLHGQYLNHEIIVLGYNHNIQSSFGISSTVIKALRDWITSKITL